MDYWGGGGGGGKGYVGPLLKLLGGPGPPAPPPPTPLSSYAYVQGSACYGCVSGKHVMVMSSGLNNNDNNDLIKQR